MITSIKAARLDALAKEWDSALWLPRRRRACLRLHPRLLSADGNMRTVFRSSAITMEAAIRECGRAPLTAASERALSAIVLSTAGGRQRTVADTTRSAKFLRES